MVLRFQVALLTIALLLATGCEGGKKAKDYSVYTGGNWRRGKQLIESHGCGTCHVIPGVRNAIGLVGPPLVWWSRRTYIAGELPNTPDNLVRWIVSPPSVEPGTAMPSVGLSEQDARDVAAYLYTLR